jgi:hypothetical protein
LDDDDDDGWWWPAGVEGLLPMARYVGPGPANDRLEQRTLTRGGHDNGNGGGDKWRRFVVYAS